MKNQFGLLGDLDTLVKLNLHRVPRSSYEKIMPFPQLEKFLPEGFFGNSA